MGAGRDRARFLLRPCLHGFFLEKDDDEEKRRI